MEILLDTNFIIYCVRQKIDFFSLAAEIIDDKIEWVVPFEVLAELEQISKRTGEKEADKLAAKIGLEMTKVICAKIVNVKGKNVDQGIVNYILDKDIVLATLDKNLKRRIKNRILTIRKFRTLELL
ncbi:PIN domain-containing protein [Candidatus Pacearchaeota archaeon]|nr:PIN domain-containing protein [Candidatus Pacearchaeota archaeon]